MACFAMLAVVAIGLTSPVRAGNVHDARDAAAENGRWTPARVREFVLRVEREMDSLEQQEYRNRGESRLPAKTCHGGPVAIFIDKAQVMRRLRPLLQEPALSCYLTTYLGCDLGRFIGVDVPSDGRFAVPDKPFTLSKVTIIEQTGDRVVADVQELGFEEVANGVAGTWTDEEPRRFTSKELANWPTGSRYTITRGADGVWRISDRRPPFAWECKSRY